MFFDFETEAAGITFAREAQQNRTLRRAQRYFIITEHHTAIFAASFGARQLQNTGFKICRLAQLQIEVFVIKRHVKS